MHNISDSVIDDSGFLRELAGGFISASHKTIMLLVVIMYKGLFDMTLAFLVFSSNSFNPNPIQQNPEIAHHEMRFFVKKNVRTHSIQ